MFIQLLDKYTDFFVPRGEYTELAFFDKEDYLRVNIDIFQRHEKELLPEEREEVESYNSEDNSEMFEKCGDTYIFKYKPMQCIGDYFFHITGTTEDECVERIYEGVMTLRYS